MSRRSCRGVAVAVAVAVALLSGVSGCPARRREQKQPEPVRRLPISKVEAFDRTAPEERLPGVSDASLLALVRKRLAASPAIELLTASRAGAHQLKLEVGVAFRGEDEGEGEGGVRRVILGSARVHVPGTIEGVELQASSVSSLPRGDAQRDKAALERVVGQLVDDILYQAALAVAPEEKLAVALTEKDTTRLAAAVEIAAVRRARACVPALIKLLEHKDLRVSDRAIGALVAVGDPRAVKPLTRLADLRDTAHMAKVIDAISDLGGQEAKEYLEFVASGHEDADIRNLASEALERLKRREKK
jgi:hypothetical protein